MGLADTPREPKLLLATPQPSARVYDEAVSIAGTIINTSSPAALRVFSGETLLGETHVFNRVEAGWSFRLLVRFPQVVDGNETQATLRFSVQLTDKPAELDLGETTVTIVPARLQERPYGDVVAPGRSDLLHRENIYGFGPPLENPGAEITRLILEYLPAGSRVLDLGCGAGAYGPPLIAEGHRWLGAETNPLCWSILERRELPFQRLDLTSPELPFPDHKFDATIAIEVLEHVEDVDSLISEIARVTRNRFLVSVPNMEVIPYYAPLGIVPWHLLESTHVNFFTRASLHAVLARHFAHVEVFSYAEPPVKSADNLPLHAHLFAIATR